MKSPILPRLALEPLANDLASALGLVPHISDYEKKRGWPPAFRSPTDDMVLLYGGDEFKLDIRDERPGVRYEYMTLRRDRSQPPHSPDGTICIYSEGSGYLYCFTSSDIPDCWRTVSGYIASRRTSFASRFLHALALKTRTALDRAPGNRGVGHTLSFGPKMTPYGRKALFKLSMILLGRVE